jgi:hypothetical protein
MKDPKTQLWEALAAFQADFENPTKGKDNPFFKSKYADLTDDWEAIRPGLKKHKLCIVQRTYNSNGAPMLETWLIHAPSGQLIKCHGITATAPKQDGPQAIKSATTYERRRQLECLLGIAPAGEDDDAEKAHGRNKAQTPDEYVAEHGATDTRWSGTGPKKEPAKQANGKITPAQRRKVFAMMKEKADALGYDKDKANAIYRQIIGNFGYESTNDIEQGALDGILDTINALNPA